MTRISKTLTTAAALSVLAFAAQAQITYVDQVWDGNSMSPIGQQGPGNDGFWDVRPFGNGATIFQNIGYSAGTDDAHRMRTYATGLDSAQEYNVYVYFWSDTSETWNVSASLDNLAGDLPNYTPASPESLSYMTQDGTTHFSDELSVNPFTTPVMLTEGNRTLWQASIGTFTGSSDLVVYIDDTGTATGPDQRVWYDGIGYELVPVPEPTSAALLGIGALVGLFAMRRKA